MKQLQSVIKNPPPIDSVVHRSAMPDLRAEFVMRMIVQFGIVAAKPAPDGLQPRSLQTPTEVVDRANQIATYAFDEFDRLGWLTHCPAPEPRERQRPPNSPRSAVTGIDGEEKQHS